MSILPIVSLANSAHIRPQNEAGYRLAVHPCGNHAENCRSRECAAGATLRNFLPGGGDYSLTWLSSASTSHPSSTVKVPCLI